MGGGFPPGMGGHAGGHAAAQPQSHSTVLTISNEQVGSLIGKGGQKIAHIRQTSGAQVKIGDATPPDTSRIVTISGNAESCQFAVFLVQQRLAEDAARNSQS